MGKRIVGIPLETDAAVLIPGVGCPNACRFCATSHFFGRAYTPYFDTGRELFDICAKVEEETGFREFFVMDENFLKRPERARELLRLMEKHNKLYRFGIFSSAETLANLGPEFLARLGVYFLWLGVESKQEVYEKNKGVDLRSLIAGLRSHGISVLASGILFLEQHDEKTIWDDIRYLVDLESDFVQFMQLGPLPLTKLYLDYEAKGLLRHDIPFEEWHGQHRLWFRHPNFTPEDSERIIREAFRFDYDVQGSSLLRMTDTTLRGYRTLARYSDPLMVARRADMKKLAEHFRPILTTLIRHGHNPRAKELATQLARRFDLELGPATVKQRALSYVMQGAASIEAWRVATGRNRYQPSTRRTTYRLSKAADLLGRPVHADPGVLGRPLGGALMHAD
jgi:haloalkane dehalogenase